MPDPVSTKKIDKEQVKLQALISRRHPAYSRNEAHWGFLMDCYNGEREWFKDNIHPYHKEGEENFSARKVRAYRFNHSKEVVDLVNKYLFRGKIVRNEEDAPDCLVDFWKNATGRGTPIDEFARQVSTYTSVVGRTWVVVDSTATDNNAKSISDQEAEDARIYAYPVLPKDMLDMSYDRQGVLQWALVRETHREDTNPFDHEDCDEHYRYRLWTRKEWALYESDRSDAKRLKAGTAPVKKVAEGSHNLNMVPITWCDHTETDALYSSTSLISDIAYLDRAVANYLSNLDVIIQEQTFSQLAMPAQSLTPGTKDHDALLKVGTKSIFTYDGESGQKPFYLSPDVNQAQLIMDAVQKIINEIYHTIGMAGERTKQDNAVGTDNSSGVAKAYDFERVNAMLVSKAHSLDRFEKRLSRLVCAYSRDEVGKDDEDFIKYPDDFDIRGLADEFDIAANLQALAMPDEIRQEQAKALIDKLFPRASEAIQKSLLDSIDKWPEDPVEMAQKMAAAVASQDTVDTTSRPTKTDESGVRKPSEQGQVTS